MRFIIAFIALAVQTAAQTSFLSRPSPVWQSAISPVGEGNECAMAPTSSNPLLICTGANGFATALQPNSATRSQPVWTYQPDPISVMSSTSGVTFSSTGSFFVYATTDTNSTSSICRVHAVSLSTTLDVKFVSPSLEGSCSGTPVLSGDDAYVFLTHNDITSGTFTILDAADGTVFYQEADGAQLLSPPGIYFKPLGGNYAAGAGNTNDLVIFGNRPAVSATSVDDSGLSTFAFQFPLGFQGTSSGLGVVRLLNDTDFESTTPPLITNSGNSMFWGVSRSKINGWTGKSFDGDAGGNNIGFSRGDPASRPVIAELAIGADTVTPTLYTGTADNEFAAISTSGTTIEVLWNITTTSPVYAQAKVAPSTSDEVVFVIEQLGIVYALDAVNGTELWNADAGAPVLGNFAINAAGDTIYFVDSDGILNAWQVADSGAPTTFAPAAPTMDTNSSSVPTAPSATNSSAVPTAPSGLTNSSVAPAAAPVGSGNATVDIIASDGNASILVDMVTSLNLAGNLSDPAFVATIFAPYDSAFTTAFNQSYLDDLVADPQWMYHLRCLVGSHIIPGFSNTTDEWVNGEEVKDVFQKPVLLNSTPPSVMGINVSSADNIADNGVVHFIPTPILPDCVEVDILTVGLSNSNFSTLTGLVDAAGLANALGKDMPLTLYAPTNAAFEKVPADVAEYLMDPANVEILRSVLFYHIVRNITYLDIVGGSGSGNYTTTAGDTISVTFDSITTFMVNNATVTLPSVLAQNGIIHVIDEVLLPPSVMLPSKAPVTMAPVTSAPVAPISSKPTPKPTKKPTAAPTTSKPTTPSSNASGSNGLLALILSMFFVIWM